MNTLGTHRLTARRDMLGVTLLELMAVIMIIGILAMIAIPGYRQYVMRAQRAEAKSALLQLQTNQERFYLQNRIYGTAAQLIAANLLAADARVGARNVQRSRSMIQPDRNDLHGYGDAEGRCGVRHDDRCPVHDVLDHGTRRSHGDGLDPGYLLVATSSWLARGRARAGCRE